MVAQRPRTDDGRFTTIFRDCLKSCRDSAKPLYFGSTISETHIHLRGLSDEGKLHKEPTGQGQEGAQKKEGPPSRLDAKDRLLLEALQCDGEQSLSTIGKQLGLSKMAVSYRIKRLKSEGILEGSHYRINPKKVGQDYLIVSQVRCEGSGPEQKKIASQIADIPGVQSVYLTFGPYDILFIARRGDMQSARDLLYDVTKIAGVVNTQTIIPHTVVKETLDVSLES